jgi:hypothetical protein
MMTKVKRTMMAPEYTMTWAAAKNSAPSSRYRTASELMTTISDRALLMGWRWKRRFNAPATQSPPKKMKRTRYMLERFSYIRPDADCRTPWFVANVSERQPISDGNQLSPFVIPSEAEGSAVSLTRLQQSTESRNPSA